MKLRDYIASLNAIIKTNHDLLDCEVVTSGDDEGNSFHAVHYSPSAGHMIGGEYEQNSVKPTTVCLN